MKTNNTKDKIYYHAALLFRDKGYAAASIRDIAEKVGIEPSSIYSHIRSKEDLLVKICMDAALYFTTGMEKIIEKPTSPLEKVSDLIDLHITAVINEPTSITVFTDEWNHLPEHPLQEFLRRRKWYENQWREILVFGMNNDVIMKGDPAIIFQTILSSVRWINTWYTVEKLPKMDAVRKELKTFILRGLKN